MKESASYGRALRRSDVANPEGNARGFAGEKARNRSPEKWDPLVPVRASPDVTRLAKALHWCGNNGASVATIPMTDPDPVGIEKKASIGLSSLSSSPNGTPAS